jgi:phage shock protein A
MGLLKRIHRLCKADIHGFLDTIESPEIILRQAVREMEEELEKSARRAAGCEQKIKQLNMRLEHWQENTEKYSQKISASFDAGNHELAKSFIRSRIELEQNSLRAKEQIKSLVLELATLEKNRVEQEKEVNAIRERAAVICEERKRACEEDRQLENALRGATTRCSVSEEEVELAFLQELARHEQVKTV